MAGGETLEASRPAIAVAADLGYCYWPYQADREHWFCKPSAAYRTHHLHLIPIESSQWLRAIAIGDYAACHPEAAGDYAALKQRLAWERHLDREAYTDAKRPFIDRITAGTPDAPAAGVQAVRDDNVLALRTTPPAHGAA